MGHYIRDGFVGLSLIVLGTTFGGCGGGTPQGTNIEPVLTHFSLPKGNQSYSCEDKTKGENCTAVLFSGYDQFRNNSGAGLIQLDIRFNGQQYHSIPIPQTGEFLPRTVSDRFEEFSVDNLAIGTYIMTPHLIDSEGAENIGGGFAKNFERL